MMRATGRVEAWSHRSCTPDKLLNYPTVHTLLKEVRMNKWMLSTVAVVALAAFVGFTNAGDKSGKHKDNGSVAIGQPAPQFALQDQTGKTHNLADYNGKVVVLEWF